ncbi:MAG: hypothetical protein QXN55_00985 [Candidatus Nitrosotenuis sp.]
MKLTSLGFDNVDFFYKKLKIINRIWLMLVWVKFGQPTNIDLKQSYQGSETEIDNIIIFKERQYVKNRNS